MENLIEYLVKKPCLRKGLGYDALSDATTVTVHIARIKKRWMHIMRNIQYIETVWGAGYRFKI